MALLRLGVGSWVVLVLHLCCGILERQVIPVCKLLQQMGLCAVAEEYSSSAMGFSMPKQLNLEGKIL